MAGFQKILLIEDNTYLLDLYSHVLTSGGYEVQTASNGEDGLVATEKFRPDLIFLDIMMPGQSGLSVLKILRSDLRFTDLKPRVIMLTNLADDEVSKQAAELGADGYILKIDISPYDLLTILDELKSKQAKAQLPETPSS